MDFFKTIASGTKTENPWFKIICLLRSIFVGFCVLGFFGGGVLLAVVVWGGFFVFIFQTSHSHLSVAVAAYSVDQSIPTKPLIV